MERPAPIRSSWVTLRDWSQHIAEPHAKEPVMSNVRFIGLDVHAETIAVAVAEPDGEVRSLGVIPNRSESIRKLVKKLGPADAAAGLLRGGPDGVCGVLAADGARREVRGGGADLGAREGRRSREDGSARRAEAGAELSRRRLDGRCGCRTRRTKRCGIWCAPGKPRRRISCARVIAWASSCCAMDGARPRR